MKRSTTNRLNMYESVHSVLNDYQSSWQGIPAFVSAVNTFETKLNLLRMRVMEQSSITTGVSMDKKLRINDLRDRMLVVQHALFLLGRASGDILLRERNHTSKTALLEMNLAGFAARCAELKLDLGTYGPQLAEYGITLESIDELIPLLQGIDEVNNSTRKAIIRRKNATQSIRELELELNELLRIELDRLILLFRHSEPGFFQSFRSARITIHYGNGSRRDEPLQPGEENLAS
jgi:hypothetical protein